MLTLKKSFLFDHVLLITKFHEGGSEGSHDHMMKSDYMIFGGPSKGLRLRLAGHDLQTAANIPKGSGAYKRKSHTDFFIRFD